MTKAPGKLGKFISKVPGGPYIAAVMAANILNFAFSLYLSRNLSFAAYGLLTLVNTLWLLAGIVITSLLQTINHRTAYLSIHSGTVAATAFVQRTKKTVTAATILISIIWLLATPTMASFFKLNSSIPLLILLPVLVTGSLAAVEKGFLQGSLAFRWLALVTIIEPLVKVITAVVLVVSGHKDIAYSSITLSVIISLFVASLFAARLRVPGESSLSLRAFPHRFMVATVATTIASTAFISIDVLLAKHYLSPTVAGQYANLSLVGKMIFYFGSIFNTLLITYVSRAIGHGKPTRPIFNKLIGFTFLASAATAAFIALFADRIVPIVFGSQAATILTYLPTYLWAMVAFTCATALVAYYLALQKYVVPVLSIIFTVVLTVGLIIHHRTIHDFVSVITFASFLQLVVLLVLYIIRDPSRQPTKIDLSMTANQRLRILHLGFEDFRKPGNGGGSIRTHEINRRIAQQHDIIVLAAKFPGYKDRTEDGVEYRHIGLQLGYAGSIISYFLALPWAVRSIATDLVVEDFAAPFSSCLSPLWNRQKKIAMVQWLNAREKSRQYHLPFWISESLGVRLHKNFIAVSDGIAQRLQTMNPQAAVTIIGNGVPATTFRTALGQHRQNIVFLGRIEREQKGIDLLLDAYANVVEQTDAKLIIAGDGPDKKWLQNEIIRRNLVERVELIGRVAGASKDKLLATAQVVVVPSRFETFGMVAIEALACGAPIVAFDIDCLREIVPVKLGILVPKYQTAAFGQALLTTLKQSANQSLEQQRRDFAATYDWDILAQKQRAIYESIADERFVPTTDTKTRQQQLACLFAAVAKINRKQRLLRIAVIGNYGNGNTGDEAILTGINIVAQRYCQPIFLVRSLQLARQAQAANTKLVKRASITGLWTLLSSDVIAIGGGGIFNKYNSPLVRMLPWLTLFLQLFGKRVIFVAIGIDSSMPSVTRFGLRLVARLSLAVTTRDQVSANFLGNDRATVIQKTAVITDPAILVTPAASKQLTHFKSRRGDAAGKQRLLISLKPTSDPIQNEKLIHLAAKATCWWHEHTGHGIDFICLSENGDFGLGKRATDATMAHDAIQLCPHGNVDIQIVGPNLQPAVAVGYVASAACVLATRLHALIFALATNTAVMGLVFESKTSNYLHDAAAAHFNVATNADSKLYDWLRHQQKT